MSRHITKIAEWASRTLAVAALLVAAKPGHVFATSAAVLDSTAKLSDLSTGVVVDIDVDGDEDEDIPLPE